MSTRPTDLISKKTQNKSLKSFKSISSDSIAEIILTSGTWSRPKGVTLSHGNLLANLEGVDKAYHLKSNSRLLSILPLSHAYEQMIGLIIPLFRGASITYLSDITAKQLKEACLERKITLIVAVPRILEVLHKEIIRQIPASKRDTFEKFIILSNILPITLRRKLYNKVHSTLGKNLRTFVVGGAPLDEKLDKFFQGLGYEVFIGYGLSETSPVLSISLDQKRTRGNVGKPLSNIKVEINKDGEIRARGKSVFHGYWPNKRQGSFFNTGDLGNFDKKGNIVLNGRIKNLVVFPNGDKIFLEDIEKIAEGFDSIDESCALDIGDEQSPHLHLFVIAKKIDLEECRVYINQKLPFGISIKSLSLAELQSLPRTHTLKLMRRKILDYHKDHIKRIKSLSS
jgi:long-chain acyl-CoA synthetase